jgi:hypothetical protein
MFTSRTHVAFLRGLPAGIRHIFRRARGIRSYEIRYLLTSWLNELGPLADVACLSGSRDQPEISGNPPMIRLLFIIQMANPGDMRCVAFFPRPVDRLLLGLVGRERTVRVILNDIADDWTSFGLSLGPGLHEHIAISVYLPFCTRTPIVSPVRHGTNACWVFRGRRSPRRR